jgi:hypothetical protein
MTPNVVSLSSPFTVGSGLYAGGSWETLLFARRYGMLHEGGRVHRW